MYTSPRERHPSHRETVPPNNSGFKLRAPSGEEFDITGPFRIGRGDECQIQVDNALASRIHASIWVDKGQLLLRDERSRNGTFVNGRRISPGVTQRLYEADRVQIVGVTYVVVTPAPLFEPPKTSPPSPGFVVPKPPPAPAAAASQPLPRPLLLAACGCALLLLLCVCVAGGFFITSRAQPILATLLAPPRTEAAVAATTTLIAEGGQPTATPLSPSLTTATSTGTPTATNTPTAASSQAALETHAAASQTSVVAQAATQAAAQVATEQGLVIFTLSGSASLTQADGENCVFADLPATSANLSLNLDFTTGQANLSLAGGGGGVRTGLRCNDSTASMSWDQDYTADLAGTVDPVSGALDLRGLLTGQNNIAWLDCRLNGQPQDCPAGYANAYEFEAQLTGTVDRLAHTASGAWSLLSIDLPTTGTWSAAD
jgi:pSer/pThr/pTyr-binding forkhead associated (FHA) protein